MDAGLARWRVLPCQPAVRLACWAATWLSELLPCFVVGLESNGRSRCQPNRRRVCVPIASCPYCTGSYHDKQGSWPNADGHGSLSWSVQGASLDLHSSCRPAVARWVGCGLGRDPCQQGRSRHRFVPDEGGGHVTTSATTTAARVRLHCLSRETCVHCAVSCSLISAMSASGLSALIVATGVPVGRAHHT